MTSSNQRDLALEHLHPIARRVLPGIVQQLRDEGHPFDMFEAFRTPQRQAYLYAQGRTRPGIIVTRSGPWASYHQYGLAADLVLHIDGQWSWDTSNPHRASWRRMHELGIEAGLEPLSWELPHLQIAGLTIEGLKAGHYPDGGDETWAENLEANIAGWSGSRAAPPAPRFLPARPEIEDAIASMSFASPLLTTDLPQAGTQGWHRKFGGQEWRFDGDGVYLRDFEGGTKPLRSPGIPTTCKAIWQLFSVPITTTSKRFGIAPELIIMTIATEAGAYREQGFTGAATFRWEAHVWNEDVNPPSQGAALARCRHLPLRHVG